MATLPCVGHLSHPPDGVLVGRGGGGVLGLPLVRDLCQVAGVGVRHPVHHRHGPPVRQENAVAAGGGLPGPALHGAVAGLVLDRVRVGILSRPDLGK